MKTRLLLAPQYAEFDLAHPRFDLHPTEEASIRAWQKMRMHNMGADGCSGCNMVPDNSGLNVWFFHLVCPQGRALYLAAWRAQKLWAADQLLLDWAAKQEEPPPNNFSAALAAMQSVYIKAINQINQGALFPTLLKGKKP